MGSQAKLDELEMLQSMYPESVAVDMQVPVTPPPTLRIPAAALYYVSNLMMNEI